MTYQELIQSDTRSIVYKPGTRERWVVKLITERHTAQTTDWYLAPQGWREVGNVAMWDTAVVVRPVERYDEGK